MQRICPICKTELLEQDIEELEGHKVHKGYCAQVLVEILTKKYQDQLTESTVTNEIDQYQLLS